MSIQSPLILPSNHRIFFSCQLSFDSLKANYHSSLELNLIKPLSFCLEQTYLYLHYDLQYYHICQSSIFAEFCCYHCYILQVLLEFAIKVQLNEILYIVVKEWKQHSQLVHLSGKEYFVCEVAGTVVVQSLATKSTSITSSESLCVGSHHHCIFTTVSTMGASSLFEILLLLAELGIIGG